MPKRIVALVLTVAIIGLVAAAAGAAKGKTHAIKFTILENGISTTSSNPSGPPTVGTTFVDAGVVTQTPGGKGATVDRITITSLSLATGTETFKGKTTIFLFHGTLSAKLKGTGKHNFKNGSDTFSGTGTYTGGTGAYKGVTGSFKFTGFNPNTPGSVTTIHATGTAAY